MHGRDVEQRDRCPCRTPTYYYGVPGRTLTLEELTEVLERFPVERAGGRTLDDTSEAQAQALLARIAALTDVLRDAEPAEPARMAARLLLSDLSAIAAHFRGRANTMGPPLASALGELRQAREQLANHPELTRGAQDAT